MTFRAYVLSLLCTAGLALTAVAPNSASAADTKTMAVAVKVAGDPWWARMDEGLKEYDAAHPEFHVFMQGVSHADGALQAQLIEDLIAQKVDALGIVPISPQTLEPVIAKARAAGIKVVTHEGSTQPTKDFDVEAFVNEDYGRHLMDELATRMGGEGEYAVFVGELTNVSHNQWVDAAVAYQKEKYPKMTLVGSKNETNEDAATAYREDPGAACRLSQHQGVPGLVFERPDRHRSGHRGSRPAGQDGGGRNQSGIARRRSSRIPAQSTTSASGIRSSPARQWPRLPSACSTARR